MELNEVTCEFAGRRSWPSTVASSSTSTVRDLSPIETFSEDIDCDLFWFGVYDIGGRPSVFELLNRIGWDFRNTVSPIRSRENTDATVPVATVSISELDPPDERPRQPQRPLGRAATAIVVSPLRRTIEAIVATRRKSVSEAAINDAVTFIARLPESAPMPIVSANEDGELVLEWLMDGKEAIAGFDGDGHFGYTMLIDGKFRPGQDEGSIENELPTDLMSYLGISTAD